MKNDTAKGCTRKSGTQCRYGSMHVSIGDIWSVNLTCHFSSTVPAKGLVVRANPASSFPSPKTFNARLNPIVVTIPRVTGDPQSALRRCQEPIRLDVTRELRWRRNTFFFVLSFDGSSFIFLSLSLFYGNIMILILFLTVVHQRRVYGIDLPGMELDRVLFNE